MSGSPHGMRGEFGRARVGSQTRVVALAIAASKSSSKYAKVSSGECGETSRAVSRVSWERWLTSADAGGDCPKTGAVDQIIAIITSAVMQQGKPLSIERFRVSTTTIATVLFHPSIIVRFF